MDISSLFVEIFQQLHTSADIPVCKIYHPRGQNGLHTHACNRSQMQSHLRTVITLEMHYPSIMRSNDSNSASLAPLIAELAYLSM